MIELIVMLKASGYSSGVGLGKLSGTSSALSNHPLSIRLVGSSDFGDFTYSVGGLGASTVNSCYKHDYGTDTWSSIANYPITIRGSGCSVDSSGDVFSFAGHNGSSYTNLSYKFNGSSWSSISNYPISVGSLNAVNIGDDIYTSGGADVSIYHNNMYKYDSVTDTYSSLANITYATAYHSMITDGTDIFISYGTGPLSAVYDKLTKYDVSLDTHTSLATMPVSQYGEACFMSGDYIYAFAGYSTSFLSAMYEYYKSLNTWSYLSDPTGHAPSTMGYKKSGNFVVFCGQVSSGTTNACYEIT